VLSFHQHGGIRFRSKLLEGLQRSFVLGRKMNAEAPFAGFGDQRLMGPASGQELNDVSLVLSGANACRVKGEPPVVGWFQQRSFSIDAVHELRHHVKGSVLSCKVERKPPA
jgi:hypothetical protein